MKRLLLLTLMTHCILFAKAQSSSFLGLKYSQGINDFYRFDHIPPRRLSRLGITYNYFINDKHGVALELNVNRRPIVTHASSFNFPLPLPFNMTKTINHDVIYSLNYIFKYKKWFVKSGFNARFIQVRHIHYVDGERTQYFFFDFDVIEFIPEYHIALGRDFEFKKFNLRINSFLDIPIDGSLYLTYGGTIGLFYNLSNKE